MTPIALTIAARSAIISGAADNRDSAIQTSPSVVE